MLPRLRDFVPLFLMLFIKQFHFRRIAASVRELIADRIWNFNWLAFLWCLWQRFVYCCLPFVSLDVIDVLEVICTRIGDGQMCVASFSLACFTRNVFKHLASLRHAALETMPTSSPHCVLFKLLKQLNRKWCSGSCWECSSRGCYSNRASNRRRSSRVS